MKKLIGLLLVLVSCHAYATTNTDGYYPIAKIWVWAGYTNGNVLIQLGDQNTQCPGGYWLQDSPNAASKNLLSTALSAYHAKTPVMIYADENSDWSGLGSKECEIKLIVLE